MTRDWSSTTTEGVRPKEWDATQHAIADMYEAGMSFEEIREVLREAARQAAKIILDDLWPKDIN